MICKNILVEINKKMFSEFGKDNFENDIKNHKETYKKTRRETSRMILTILWILTRIFGSVES